MRVMKIFIGLLCGAGLFLLVQQQGCQRPPPSPQSLAPEPHLRVALQQDPLIVKEINIEGYLMGVLAHEIYADWPLPTLMAQAVASRTYALFKSIERRKEDFALHDTVKSQVYGGAAVQNSLSDEAVEATRGEVLSFNGNIFPAFFHASCGGQTAQADLIWPVEPHPVLQGVSDPFCKGTPHDEWSLKLPLREVELAMQNHGFPAQNLKEIELLGRDASGRIREVKLTY